MAARAYKGKKAKKAASKSVNTLIKEQVSKHAKLRVDFNLSLARVYQKAAYESGVNECHTLMRENDEGKEQAKIFLSILTDKNVVVGTSQYEISKAFHAAMFAVLAEIFKTGLIDSQDGSVPTRKKAYVRIFNFMTKFFFNETHEKIQDACALSIVELLENVFPELLDPLKSDELHAVFLRPLFQCVHGGGVSLTQVSAASHCLRKLVLHLIQRYPQLVTNEFARRFVTLAVTHRITKAKFMVIIQDLLDFFGLDVGAIAGKSSPLLFNHVINQLNQMVTEVTKIGGRPSKD